MPNTGASGGVDGPAPGRRTQQDLKVVAGVLTDRNGRVLLAQRGSSGPYAGQWEFPGGKIEPDETVYHALSRELDEELGVTTRAARPLIRFRHRYPEFSVDLSVWCVDRYAGMPASREGQTLQWVARSELSRWPLLAADRPVIAALLLPAHYVFTPWDAPIDGLISRLRRLPADALLRVRRPAATAVEDAAALAATAVEVGLGPVLVDSDAATESGGLHLRAAELGRIRRRPSGFAPARWLGASVHSRAELERAASIGADFAVLGPVFASRSHPGRSGLGWSRWAQMREGFALPVYAIGGLGPRHLPTARAHGAQGVAGISAYWSSESGSTTSSGAWTE